MPVEQEAENNEDQWRIIFSTNVDNPPIFRILLKWFDSSLEMKKRCTKPEKYHVDQIDQANITGRCIIIGDPNNIAGEELHQNILKIAEANNEVLMLLTTGSSETKIQEWTAKLKAISETRFFVYPKGMQLTKNIKAIFEQRLDITDIKELNSPATTPRTIIRPLTLDADNSPAAGQPSPTHKVILDKNGEDSSTRARAIIRGLRLDDGDDSSLTAVEPSPTHLGSRL